MRFFILIVIILAPSFAAELESRNDLCTKYATGIHKIYYLNTERILAVAREEPVVSDPEGIRIAFDSAEMKAKAHLAKYKNVTSLTGARKIFSCLKDDFAYIGILWSEQDEINAKSLRDLL